MAFSSPTRSRRVPSCAGVQSRVRLDVPTLGFFVEGSSVSRHAPALLRKGREALLRESLSSIRAPSSGREVAARIEAGGKLHRSSRSEVSRHLPPTSIGWIPTVLTTQTGLGRVVASKERHTSDPSQLAGLTPRFDDRRRDRAGAHPHVVPLHRRRSPVELKNDGGRPGGRLEHLLPRLLGPIGTDRGLRVPLLQAGEEPPADRGTQATTLGPSPSCGTGARLLPLPLRRALPSAPSLLTSGAPAASPISSQFM